MPVCASWLSTIRASGSSTQDAAEATSLALVATPGRSRKSRRHKQRC